MGSPANPDAATLRELSNHAAAFVLKELRNGSGSGGMQCSLGAIPFFMGMGSCLSETCAESTGNVLNPKNVKIRKSPPYGRGLINLIR